MKKIFLLLCPLFVMQLANSQKLIIDAGTVLKRGIYMTYDEFKYNSPSMPLDFEIIDVDAGQYYNLKADKEKFNQIGVVWGFCDGNNTFINRDFNMSRKRIFRPQSQFNKILYLGRYSYFLTLSTIRHIDQLNTFQYLPYVIEFNTGEELCLNCEINFGFIKQSQFKKILTKDSELWVEYKSDKSKEDLFLKYIKIYSERYRDEVLN